MEEKVPMEYTLGFGRVNLIAFILIIPITAILLLPFVWIWDYETFKIGKDAFSDYFLPIFVGGIIVHELLHGLTWGSFDTE